MACSRSTQGRAPCRTRARARTTSRVTTRYELTVRASDGSLHSEVTVTVNVTDVAEGAGVRGRGAMRSHWRRTPTAVRASVALGAVSATDPENSTITYSIEAGDSGGLFEIDTGERARCSYHRRGRGLRIRNDPSYDLTVRASDGGLHSDVTVAVTVTDVRRRRRCSRSRATPSHLAENADGALFEQCSRRTRLSATDPDNSTGLPTA